MERLLSSFIVSGNYDTLSDEDLVEHKILFDNDPEIFGLIAVYNNECDISERTYNYANAEKAERAMQEKIFEKYPKIDPVLAAYVVEAICEYSFEQSEGV